MKLRKQYSGTGKRCKVRGQQKCTLMERLCKVRGQQKCNPMKRLPRAPVDKVDRIDKVDSIGFGTTVLPQLAQVRNEEEERPPPKKFGRRRPAKTLTLLSTLSLGVRGTTRRSLGDSVSFTLSTLGDSVSFRLSTLSRGARGISLTVGFRESVSGGIHGHEATSSRHHKVFLN